MKSSWGRVAGLLIAAAVGTMGSTSVLADGFESYAVGSAPAAPWVLDPVGTVVTNAVAYEGSQALQMHASQWSEAVLPLAIAPGQSATISLAAMPAATPSGWNFSNTAYVGIRLLFGESVAHLAFKLDNLGYYNDFWDPVTAEDYRIVAGNYYSANTLQIGTYSPAAWHQLSFTFDATNVTIASGSGSHTIARIDSVANPIAELVLWGFDLQNYGGTPVYYDAVTLPEPASLGLLVLGSLVILRRK